MKKILLTLIIIFGLSSPCFATNWFWIDATDNGRQVYVDLDSIKNNQNYATAWIKYLSPNNESILYKMAFNRPNRLYAITNIIVYDANGRVKGIDNEKIYDWNPIPPGTKLESFFQQLW